MADFSVVGARLHEIALETSTEGEADAFGRSAFNRYYYAAFLLAREMFREMYKGPESINHADIPAHLKGRVLRAITTRARAQRKAGVPEPTGSRRLPATSPCGCF